MLRILLWTPRYTVSSQHCQAQAVFGHSRGWSTVTDCKTPIVIFSQYWMWYFMVSGECSVQQGLQNWIILYLIKNLSQMCVGGRSLFGFLKELLLWRWNKMLIPVNSLSTQNATFENMAYCRKNCKIRIFICCFDWMQLLKGLHKVYISKLYNELSRVWG